MALIVKRSGTLLQEDLRLKVLIYGLPGRGKTKFVGTVPGVGVAACETGNGNGLMSIANENVEYCEPETFSEIEEFCTGKVFKDNPAVALDSLTEMARGPVKDEALKIPRLKGQTDKRAKGVPELDDYGVMGELTRKLLLKLFQSHKDKHIVVTAKEKYDRANADDAPGTESLIVPDLPGQMALASAGMFDLVFRIRERAELLDPRDAKSRVVRRYLVTTMDGTGCLARCRINRPEAIWTPVLDKEELYDPANGKGGFPYILNKVIEGMKK